LSAGVPPGVSTFFSNPDRIKAVCADVVEHFYSTVDPLGMKAQVVVFDRAACVDYHRELERLLAERYQAGQPLDEAAVVMTVGGGKDEDKGWQDYALTETQEEDLLKRFRTYGDTLKFLVVTSKLGTGFNAPIEGVMYLDKPLKKHTLFQTITRTNRTWKNPETGQEKRYGLVVDYVGLGDGFVRAMAPANPDQEQRSIDIAGLLDLFEVALKSAMKRFAGLDWAHPGATTLLEAHTRIPDVDRDEFAAEFGVLEGIWESVAPDPRLLAVKDQYRFLAKV
jgi:type I restriction enzyme R subunit